MAKRRIKRPSAPRKRNDVRVEDAAATKRFFTITGIVVLVLLVIIFVVYQQVA